MKKRFKRLLQWRTIPPLLMLLEGIDKMQLLTQMFIAAKQYGVLAMMISPPFVIVLSLSWVTALILWPEIRDRFPISRSQPRLRTWIDEGDRHELLHRRIRQCKSGDLVRFVSITGKSVLLPEERGGESLKAYPFPQAMDLGTTFEGILLDPDSAEAEFRSAIETTGAPKPERLLQIDARQIADLPKRYERAGIKQDITKQRLHLKYVSVGLPFSLWLFDDVALIEPYHIGKRGGVGNLCEFSQIVIPRKDVNYDLLVNHFDNLWNHAPSRPVWSS